MVSALHFLPLSSGLLARAELGASPCHTQQPRSWPLWTEALEGLKGRNVSSYTVSVHAFQGEHWVGWALCGPDEFSGAQALSSHKKQLPRWFSMYGAPTVSPTQYNCILPYTHSIPVWDSTSTLLTTCPCVSHLSNSPASLYSVSQGEPLDLRQEA